MKVKFINVGRNNITWEEKAPTDNWNDLEYGWLYFQVKKCLMSNNIDFILNEDGKTGTIVGNFHGLGEFELIFD